MNRLKGTIINLQSSPVMSIVEVDVAGDVFSSIVLETPDTSAYLKTGHNVEIVFKETEVSIGKNLSGLISIRNRFKARIKEIEQHALLTTVCLTYKECAIVSIISTGSALRLDLKVNDDVEWLVKTNEVSLCPAM